MNFGREVDWGITPVRIVMALLCLSLASCRDWNPTPPPNTQAGQPNVVQPLSTVEIPVSASTSDIASSVVKAYSQKTLESGRTDGISTSLLADEKITKQEAEQVLLHAAVPGICEEKQVPTQVKTGVNCVAAAAKCVVHLFHKCGQVCTDVFKTVLNTVKSCTADQAAVYRTEITPVIDVEQTAVPTTIWINHQVKLQDLSLSLSGNKISVDATLPVNISLDVKQGVFGADLTVKGALDCNALLSVSSQGEIHLTPNAEVNVTLSDFSWDAKKLCVPGAAQAIDVARYLNPALLVSSDVLKKIVDQTILDKLNESLQKTSDRSLNFSSALQKVAIELQQPHPIGNDATLLLHPARLLASDVAGVGVGGANQIQISVGLEARPEVGLGSVPAQPSPTELPFVLSPAGSSFFIDAIASIDLPSAQARLKSTIDDLIVQKYSDKGVKVTGVEVYQSGHDLALAVSVERTAGMFKNLGTIYLLATPQLSVDGREIDLTGIHFDLATRNLLLKVAAWLLDSRVEEYLEEKAKLPIAGKLQIISEKFSSFSLSTPAGTLKGELKALKPEGIWVANGSLWVEALASGDASFVVSPERLSH